MTLIEVFDALDSKTFTCLETKSGTQYGGTLLQVNFCEDLEHQPACIEVDESGLTLHFNARYNGEMHGVSVAFGGIVLVR